MADEKPLVLHGRAQLLKPVITQIMAMHQLLEGKDIGAHYSVPVLAFQNHYEFHPQVTLVFKQTMAEANPSMTSTTDPDDIKEPVDGEISYRLVNETHETMTESKALLLAQKIKSKFAIPVCQWTKGVTNYTYWHDVKGYRFRIAASTEAMAKTLIEMTLDLAGEAPDWDLLREHIPKKTFPVKPLKKTIYGTLRRPPRRRPVETVRFKYAELHVWGVPRAITLVDLTGRRPSPLVIN